MAWNKGKYSNFSFEYLSLSNSVCMKKKRNRGKNMTVPRDGEGES